MKTLNNRNNYLKIIADYIAREFKTIGTSYSILLVMIGGVFVYGLLYNYMYQPNLIRKAPVVVADLSQSSLSREYVRLLSASSQVEVNSHANNILEAKELMKTREVVGIVYIPRDFERRVGRGDQSVFLAMVNTSAFLNFAAIQEATSGAMVELDGRHRSDMITFLPLPTLYAMSQAQPINVVGTALFNHTEGYGSYLIPVVLILIIFQTLMMVIGMISGGERYKKTILYYKKNGLGFGNMMAIVLSKTFVYSVLYAIFAYFLIGLLPQIFSIPNIGDTMDIITLLIPFFMASCFFGFTCSLVYADSESPILMIAFFSVGLVFLSGISYPLELIPWYWKVFHYIIPAPPAVLGYVKVNSMGASIADIKTEYITLWIQCLVYFLTACFVYRYNIKKESVAIKEAANF